MTMLNFKPQFVPAIETGQKPHTIRALRKKPICVFDKLHLYTGARTKACRKIGEATCQAVARLSINPACRLVTVGRIVVDPEAPSPWFHVGPMSAEEIQRLALADGFATADDFFQFFANAIPQNYVSFEGHLYVWGDTFRKAA